MRGYLTRCFSITTALIGYYDMTTNKMVELCTVAGKWKTAEQVQKYCKKYRDTLRIPKDKQITVLSMETTKELRRMSHDDFYKYSEVVEKDYADTDSVKTTKTNNTKKGKKK